MPWMGSDIDPSLSCPPDLPGSQKDGLLSCNWDHEGRKRSEKKPVLAYRVQRV